MKSNQKMAACAALLAVAMACTAALAAESPEEMWNISAEGPLVYTLPTDPVVTPDKVFDAYILTWEPVSNAHAYYIGVTQQVKSVEGQTYYLMADGWIGPGKVKDGQGTEYAVESAVFDSIQLDGSATEADLAPILNALKERREETAKDSYYGVLGEIGRHYVIVMIVPQAGEPVRQSIALPMPGEALE